MEYGRKNKSGYGSGEVAKPKRTGKNRRDQHMTKRGSGEEYRNEYSPAPRREKNYGREQAQEFVRAERFEAAAREDMIEGRNAVIEALKSDRTIEYIMIAKGDTKGSISVVTALAQEKSVVVKYVERAKLDGMSETGAHQGVIAIVTPYTYFSI